MLWGPWCRWPGPLQLVRGAVLELLGDADVRATVGRPAAVHARHDAITGIERLLADQAT